MERPLLLFSLLKLALAGFRFLVKSSSPKLHVKLRAGLHPPRIPVMEDMAR